MEWNGYKYGKDFEFKDLNKFIIWASKSLTVIQKTKKLEIINNPASFDIETSSFYLNDKNGNPQKFACMYIWQFGLNGSTIYGRTWEEYKLLIEKLSNYLQLGTNRRLYVYVHNLGYEFQFIKKHWNWNKVFAIKHRRPVYALCDGIEYRCSYFLSNYSLEYIGEHLLNKYIVKKLVGYLDYSLVRHSKTLLTKEEIDYALNDVKVVMSYIQEKIEQDGDISKIPLTNTGYVRNYCRKECFFEDCETEEDKQRALLNYRAIMNSLQITSEEEYQQLHRAFMGGFTHASALYSRQLVTNVGSADLTSSYPFCMVGQYFPMTRAKYIGDIEDAEQLKQLLKTYCCLFDIQFTNLQPIHEFENVISLSKCLTSGKVITNNGRVVSAEELQTTITELDYDTISKFYVWDSIKILNMRVYERGYLPRPLIIAILNLYKDKTSLKGIDGKETEYMVAKNMINASFGMMVTNIVRDEYQFEEDWVKFAADTEQQLKAYNNNFNRFLYYAWGVWVTAHARHNLFSAINEFGTDYIYSDTDSIKGVNFDSHMEYFKNYNQKVMENLLDMCNFYSIPFEMCQPTTKKGSKKLIGLWEIEKGYKKFKTLGAKRYLYQYHDGFLQMTVSGINKKLAVPYLIAKWNNIPFDSEEYKTLLLAYKDDEEAKQKMLSKNYNYEPIFEEFDDCLYIPAEHTGKLTMTYIDHETIGLVTDYLGSTDIFHEMSSLHSEPQSYFLSIVNDYIKYLEGVEYVEY